MKFCYLDIYDSNHKEETNIKTIIGLKQIFADDLATFILTNDIEKAQQLYGSIGLNVTIYENQALNLFDLKGISNSIINNLKSNINNNIIFIPKNSIKEVVGDLIASELNVPYFDCYDEVNHEQDKLILSKDINNKKVHECTKIKAPCVISVNLNGLLETSVDSKIDVKKLEYTTEKVESFEPNNSGKNNLEKSKVVVTAGMGMKSKTNLPLLYSFAKHVSGEVGATKAVTDNGWISSDRMIGISNLSISPDIYYSFGVSGAVQHTVGIENSKYIVAVNIDPNAPIFKLADYGIIGDATKVLEKLVDIQ